MFTNIDVDTCISRDSYDLIHNIAEAHKFSKGKGIKVGLLDWGFGYLKHSGLYTGGVDFSNNIFNFNNVSEHGYWMTNALREVAPECETYALGTYIHNSENKWVDSLINAIDWSIENNIDILTLSHQKITNINRAKFDEAVNRAIDKGIVTTFIHYDNPNNILPDGLFANTEEERKPDLNIFHYDYNGFANGNPPYLSISSTSPVVAGFVAILKSINNNLSPSEYKDLLINTSKSISYNDRGLHRQNVPVKHVADIGNAVRYLIENVRG
ncbi:peptidase [Anaerocolumna sp.]|uniref:peptidase n=1 Tax=Anaerocolumna sp. TaxID=2041569 RepID=UPI0028AD641E|nr:peptidase [Anaerocolumna sp.]